MRHKVLAIAAASVLAVGLAGCSTGDAGADGDVTIKFQEQFTDAQSEAMKALVARFEEETPGIKVQLLRDNDSGFYDKLVTQITGGAGPDMVRVDPAKAPQYIASGWTLPLDDVIDASEYFPAALEAVTKADGTLHGVPLDVDALALFYRTDLLEAAGLDAAPTTWDEFQAAAEAMTVDGNYGAGLFAGWGAFEFYPWLWQAGAEVLNDDQTEAVFNSPEAVSALQFWVDLQKSAMPAGMATADEDAVKGPFIAGKLGMLTSGPWMIPSLKNADIDGTWAVAPLPAGKESATVLGGLDLLVLKNSKHPDETKQFLAWLMEDQNIGEYYSAIGGIPAKTSLFEDPKFADDPYVAQFKLVLEQARSRPAIANSIEVDDALTEALQAALAGTATPQEALDKAVQKANKALSE